LAQPVVTDYRNGGRYDERFNSDDIQRLYEASDYPLRKAE
jgi:hypothetical protein